MTRALAAVAKSKIAALIDGLRLDPAEAVAVGLDLAIRHSRDAHLDRRGLHTELDTALAATTAGKAAE